MARLLCIGWFPYDVEHLLTIAHRSHEQIGLVPCFVSNAPDDVAAEVRAQVSAEGFEALDVALAADDRPTARNPIKRFRQLREANLRLIDRVLSEIQPAAVLATVNSPPSFFLDEAARRGVPTILLQLWFWGSRSFHRAWQADDRRTRDRTMPLPKRFKRRLSRRVGAFYGFRPHIEWNLRHAKIAVQGPGIQRRLVADGIPEENVVASGNPVLDDLYRLKEAPHARQRIRAHLGLPERVEVVTHFRPHDARLLTLDPRSREESQLQIVRAIREAAPDAQLVVKIHPKEGDAEAAFVRSIDPQVRVVGNEVLPNELIAASDLTVATVSTTLLHSVALDRPTVSAFFWPGLDYWRRETDWSGVDRVFSPVALVEAVRRHLGDQTYQAEWSARREAFTREELLVDGQGTSRVVDLIERLTRERRLEGVVGGK